MREGSALRRGRGLCGAGCVAGALWRGVGWCGLCGGGCVAGLGGAGCGAGLGGAGLRGAGCVARGLGGGALWRGAVWRGVGWCGAVRRGLCGTGCVAGAEWRGAGWCGVAWRGGWVARAVWQGCVARSWVARSWVARAVRHGLCGTGWVARAVQRRLYGAEPCRSAAPARGRGRLRAAAGTQGSSSTFPTFGSPPPTSATASPNRSSGNSCVISGAGSSSPSPNARTASDHADDGAPNTDRTSS